MHVHTTVGGEGGLKNKEMCVYWQGVCTCMLLHKKLLSPRKHVVVESIVFKFLVLQSYAHHACVLASWFNDGHVVLV